MEDETKNKVEEPAVEYAGKRLTFFNSFEEAELHGLKEMAAHTYEQRLSNLEILRKRTLNSDTRLARVITIIKGSA